MNQPERLRIGLAANLDEGGSVHREAFLRAVEMARKTLPSHRVQVELVLANDHATRAGGQEVARQFLEAQVRLVIGHFASAAAAAAADVYAPCGIPLILPAASVDDLVDGKRPVFRICDPDRSLVDAIAVDLAREHQGARVVVAHDGGFHGSALANALRDRLGTARVALGEHAPSAEVVVFAGMFRSSAAYARALFDARFRGILYLTDDAVHPNLPGEVGGAGDRLLAYGLEPARWCPHAEEVRAEYASRWPGEPGTYFLETHAAIVIAYNVVNGSADRPLADALVTGAWRTALGDVRFVAGEGGRGRHTLFAVKKGALQPLRRAGAPGSTATPRAE